MEESRPRFVLLVACIELAPLLTSADALQPKLTLAELQELDRHYDCPLDHPVIEDLLWSDPEVIDGFLPNVRRNAGVLFGYDMCEQFCRTFGVDFIIRSHESKEEGFANELDGKCYTIFSASNYCNSGNKGAFINFDLANEFAPLRTASQSVVSIADQRAASGANSLNVDLQPFMRVTVFASSKAADCSVSLRRVALIEGVIVSCLMIVFSVFDSCVHASDMILHKMAKRISHHRVALLEAMSALDSRHSGTLVGWQIENAMERVLEITIPFLHFASQLGLKQCCTVSHVRWDVYLYLNVFMVSICGLYLCIITQVDIRRAQYSYVVFLEKFRQRFDFDTVYHPAMRSALPSPASAASPSHASGSGTFSSSPTLPSPTAPLDASIATVAPAPVSPKALPALPALAPLKPTLPPLQLQISTVHTSHATAGLSSGASSADAPTPTANTKSRRILIARHSRCGASLCIVQPQNITIKLLHSHILSLYAAPSTATPVVSTAASAVTAPQWAKHHSLRSPRPLSAPPDAVRARTRLWVLAATAPRLHRRKRMPRR